MSVATDTKVAKDAKAPAPAAAEPNGKAIAPDADAAGSDDEEEPTEETTKSKAEQSNALNKLTDVVEETQQMDENKMKEAFQKLQKQEEADKEAERKREKALAAVKVKKEDVELIAREMELTSQQADRKLREADGDVVACLKALVA